MVGLLGDHHLAMVVRELLNYMEERLQNIKTYVDALQVLLRCPGLILSPVDPLRLIADHHRRASPR
jgi:hypothetical protein